WSRVVHMAEDALDSEVQGTSALGPILNRLNDLNKTIGGSAEAYFRNARGKYSFETSPDFKGTISETDKADLVTEIDAFTNNWKDAIRLSGITAKTLDTPQDDPTGTVKAAVEFISGTTGIPIRILLGVGAGQLAGNEDKASYNQLVSDRQDQECTPWLLRALTVLAQAKMIPEIPPNAVVKWPVTQVLNATEQATVRKTNSEALSNVATALNDMSGLSGEMTANQAIEEILEMTYNPLLDDGLDE
ncbi:MAG: DUF1073 domain-containing protein, partial [Gammaproteobacteria bacterium]|nr:DUF1073 domain-containing protein [Gammaproteobacteria bacterium]